MHPLLTPQRKYQVALLAAVLLVPVRGMTASPTAGKAPLQMGILPYLSAEQLFRFFSPMKIKLVSKRLLRMVKTPMPNLTRRVD